MPRRPPPPQQAPPGSSWIPVAEHPDTWRVHPGRACRYTIARHTSCGAPAVAALNRGKTITGPHGPIRRVPAWWGYCGEHLHAFGRWIEAGRVWSWQLTPDEDADFFAPPIETR